MKKAIMLLAIVALITSFVGCGNETASTNTTTVADVPTITESPADVTVTTEPEPEVSFDELTAVDNEECVIKITDIDPNNSLGYTLDLYLENKSATTTYMFAVNSANVNGINVSSAFATEVAPGKKANTEIYFQKDMFEGIEFTDIELTFRVYNSKDWFADPVAIETVNVYPLGQENATQYIREAKDTDTVLVDNEYVTVIITDYVTDHPTAYAANIYMVNKTDVEVMFSANETSINGYMIDPHWARSVPSGKCAFSYIGWYNSDLAKNGIKTVEEIEFVLIAANYKDLLSDHFVDQVCKLTP